MTREEAVYEGDWQAGQQHGHGMSMPENGTVYEVEWKLGKPLGQGKGTNADGPVYEGDWQAGERQGQGKGTAADGSVYEGDWQAGKRHGQGKVTDADGPVYEGEWQAGKRHGQGKFTDADGTVYPGATELLAWYRTKAQVMIASDTFHELSEPIVQRMGGYNLFANTFKVDSEGRINGYRLRIRGRKDNVIRSLKEIGYRIIAIGDGYAEHLADDGGRYRQREVGDDVHAA